MFELHVAVAGFVMLNFLELIMEIVPNYPTNYRPYPSTNGNGYGNSYGNSSNNTRAAPFELEVMLKDFIGKQKYF
jgi:hypothetical protein